MAPAIVDITGRAKLAASIPWRPNESEEDWVVGGGGVLVETARSDCLFALAESMGDVGSGLESRVGVGWSGPPTTAIPWESLRSSSTVSGRRRRIKMTLGNFNLSFNMIFEGIVEAG